MRPNRVLLVQGSRTGRPLRVHRLGSQQANGLGFTLIEVLVVILVIGILMAIAAPNFRGGSVVSADEHAQALAHAAANQVANAFGQTQTYQEIEPGQLGCQPSTNCAPGAPLTWQSNGMTWVNYGAGDCGCTNANTATVIAPNSAKDGFVAPNGQGDATSNVVALLTRTDATDGGSTAVAVTAGPPANDCWFVILHSVGGPPVFGYLDTKCNNFTACWQQAPPYNRVNGCAYEDGNTRVQYDSFPPDPNV